MGYMGDIWRIYQGYLLRAHANKPDKRRYMGVDESEYYTACIIPFVLYGAIYTGKYLTRWE